MSMTQAQASLYRVYRNYRYHAHAYLSRFPGVYVQVRRLIGDHDDRIVNKDCDLVIEGAPRVASTYCAFAIHLAQPKELRVFMHSHAPANVVRASDLGIPALVLIREPAAAISSLLMLDDYLSFQAAARRYLNFYRTLENRRPSYVLCDFMEITRRPEVAVERLNAQYGRAFTTFVHTPAHERKVLQALRLRDMSMGKGAEKSYAPNPAKATSARYHRIDNNTDVFRACAAIYERLSPLSRPPAA